MPKQPTWKRILSHLYEFHIESTGSDYNLGLHLSYSRGRYQLSTENAIYSFGDLYSNYYKAFEAIDLKKRNIEKVLILGFGLGSIPLMLENNFKENYEYTGVEIDKEVIYLANKYVVYDLKSSINLLCSNAMTFVENCEDEFDMICVDLFLDDIIPEEFQQQDFLGNVKDLLAPEGILLYNRLASTAEDKLESQAFYKEQFLPIFPNGKHIDVDGNWMFINELV